MNPSLWGLEILLSVSLSHSLAVCADLWLHLLWLGNLSNCAIPGEAEELKNTPAYIYTDI